MIASPIAWYAMDKWLQGFAIEIIITVFFSVEPRLTVYITGYERFIKVIALAVKASAAVNHHYGAGIKGRSAHCTPGMCQVMGDGYKRHRAVR